MGLFLDTAEKILQILGRPMSAKGLVHQAQLLNYMDFSNGRTPFQTIKARISEDIRKYGEKSRFKRTAKGKFALRTFDTPEYKAPHFEKVIKQEDHVLVFKSELLDGKLFFNGIKEGGASIYKFILNPNNTFFIPRLQAESDPRFKQIISYVIIRKKDTILRFVRGSYSSADKMLKGRYCIGFGGHVQKTDLDNNPLFSFVDNGYLTSIERELNEELKLPYEVLNNKNFNVIGLINDDSSDVGKVHFAIVHILDLGDLYIKSAKELKGEKSINQLTFVPIKDLGKEFELYEYWSKLCIRKFFKNIEIKCRFKRIKNYNLSRHPKVIAIVGSIGSGKTEASRILYKNFNYKLISSGRILQDIIKCGDLKDIGRSRFQDLAYKYISTTNGPNELANYILSIIREEKEKYFVIDGIRNERTFSILKSELGRELTLIFVESTIDNCYKFYNGREGDTNILNFYNFINHPVEKEIDKLLVNANLVIYNHGTLKSFEGEIKKYFKEILEYAK